MVGRRSEVVGRRSEGVGRGSGGGGSGERRWWAGGAEVVASEPGGGSAERRWWVGGAEVVAAAGAGSFPEPPAERRRLSAGLRGACLSAGHTATVWHGRQGRLMRWHGTGYVT